MTAPVPETATPAPWGAGDLRPGERVPLYVWTMLASLGCNIFSGNSQYLGFPIGPDRVFLGATFALLLLDRSLPRLRWRPLYGVMIALVLWTAWSALTAGTLFQKDGIFALLDRIIVPFLMFVLGPLIFSTEARRTLLLKLLTLVGIYLGITAVFEVLGPSSLVFPSYIMDPELGILFGRARGPFLSSEPNGMVMGISLFMAMTLFARTRGAWRITAVVATICDCVGLILALTRSDWIATIVAGLIIGWMVPTVRRRLPAIVVSLVAAFAAFLAAVPAAAAALSDRFNMVSSVYDRQNTNAAGVRIVEAQPLFGIGWHRFIDVGQEWVRQADTYPVTNVAIEIHNVFLSRAAETGLPGAAMWVLAVLMGPVYAIYRMPRAGFERTWGLILIAAVAYWFIPSMTSPNPYPLPNNLMWLIGGFASSRFMLRPTTGEAPLTGAGPAVDILPRSPATQENPRAVA